MSEREEHVRFNSDGESISSFVIKEWDEGEDFDFDGTVETERNWGRNDRNR